MASKRLGLIAGAIVALTAANASAQYIGSELGSADRGIQGDGQGVFVEQSLTTPIGDATVMAGPLANAKFGTNEEAGVHTIHVPGVSLIGDGDPDEGQTLWFLQTGLAFGLARGVEVGMFTPALLAAPELAHGDLPVFLTLSTTGSGVDIGFRNTVTVPTDTDAPWRWNPGAHVLGRFKNGRFDLGAFFPLVFVDDDTTIASLEIPLRVTYDVTSSFHLGIESGIRKLDIGEGENDLFIPIGMHALYSLGADDHRFDIGARFHWHSFFWAGAPEDTSDRVLQSTYMISFGVNAHFDIGNGMANAE